MKTTENKKRTSIIQTKPRRRGQHNLKNESGPKNEDNLEIMKIAKINAEESKREDCQNEDDLKNKSKMIIIIKKKYKCGTMSLCGRGGGTK